MNLEDYDFDRLLALGYTEKATGDLKDACWKGYTAVGLKKKGGRTVPNCVPVNKSKSDHAEEMKRKPLIAGPSAGSPSFAETEDETLDFARCERPDGTHYGTSGTCRKGKEVAELEKRIARQEAWLKKASPGKFTRNEIEIEKKELQRLKSQLAGMKSTTRNPVRRSEEDVKRGGKMIGTSPRNKLIDNINEFKARLKDARSDAERELLRDTIRKAEAQLKAEGG